MAKTDYVTVRLTRLEAEALDRAVGNSLGSEEDALAVLLTMKNVNAAYRAVKKLQAAVWGKNNG